MSLLKCLSHISTHRHIHTHRDTDTHIHREIGKSMSYSQYRQYEFLRGWTTSLHETSGDRGSLVNIHLTHQQSWHRSRSTTLWPWLQKHTLYILRTPPPPPSNFKDTIQCCTLMCAVIYYLNGQLLTLAKACRSCCEVCGLEAVNSGVDSSETEGRWRGLHQTHSCPLTLVQVSS